jgi:hypothetical protein
MVSESGKPTVHDLGLDVGALAWQRSGGSADAIEVAFAQARGDRWVLMRQTGDIEGPVHVFNSDEWDAFVDGVKNGEFDDMQI